MNKTFSLMDMHMFRCWASSSMRGWVGLCRRYICCTIVLTHWLAAKLLLALGTTVSLGYEFHGTHEHILASESSGTFRSLTYLPKLSRHLISTDWLTAGCWLSLYSLSTVSNNVFDCCIHIRCLAMDQVLLTCLPGIAYTTDCLRNHVTI
jgi:hypothetical protein